MKCKVKYIVTIRWNYLGTRKYTFDSFYEANKAICYVRGICPDVKVMCKSERGI